MGDTVLHTSQPSLSYEEQVQRFERYSVTPLLNPDDHRAVGEHYARWADAARDIGRIGVAESKHRNSIWNFQKAREQRGEAYMDSRTIEEYGRLASTISDSKFRPVKTLNLKWLLSEIEAAGEIEVKNAVRAVDVIDVIESGLEESTYLTSFIHRRNNQVAKSILNIADTMGDIGVRILKNDEDAPRTAHKWFTFMADRQPSRMGAGPAHTF